MLSRWNYQAFLTTMGSLWFKSQSIQIEEIDLSHLKSIVRLGNFKNAKLKTVNCPEDIAEDVKKRLEGLGLSNIDIINSSEPRIEQATEDKGFITDSNQSTGRMAPNISSDNNTIPENAHQAQENDIKNITEEVSYNTKKFKPVHNDESNIHKRDARKLSTNDEPSDYIQGDTTYIESTVNDNSKHCENENQLTDCEEDKTDVTNTSVQRRNMNIILTIKRTRVECDAKIALEHAKISPVERDSTVLLMLHNISGTRTAEEIRCLTYWYEGIKDTIHVPYKKTKNDAKTMDILA